MKANSQYDIHSDTDFFRDSVLFTAREMGFPAGLVEKDYYCSLVLMRIYGDSGTPLVFKGGTCLSKCHTDFFRMSEDLDFMVPIPSGSPRSRRSKAMDVFRKIWQKEICVPPFKETVELMGHNNSLQYIGELEYKSALGEMTGNIKVEVGLREELLCPLESKGAATILINPFTLKRSFAPYPVKNISMPEAYAEKMRAALTRKEPAIRDYFDLDYAARVMKFNFSADNFIELVGKKLAVPGNERIDISEDKRNVLSRQIGGALKPVLREQDYILFDLGRIFKLVKELGEKLIQDKHL